MGMQISRQVPVGIMESRCPAESAVEAAAPVLTIRLLGGFAILRGDAPLPGSWRTEKARARQTPRAGPRGGNSASIGG